MAIQTPAPDLAAIKQRQQATWSSGDYSKIGVPLTLPSELLCEAVERRAGQRGLDVATGAGNAAIAAARRYCEVTGADYVPALLERARERAAIEGLPVCFEEGDAEALPYPDGAFDAVLSTFGVMFAPDQERAAAELLRVCRPGGKIGLACWTPDGWIGEVFRTTGRHVPPPAGLRSPVLWGTEERLRELFGDGIAELRTTRRSHIFRFHSAEHYLEVFRGYYGPTLKAFATLDGAAQDALARDLTDAIGRFNRADDGTMFVPSDYLEIVAIKAAK